MSYTSNKSFISELSSTRPIHNGFWKVYRNVEKVEKGF